MEALIDDARRCCLDALGTDAVQATVRALALEGVTPAVAGRFVEAVTENPATHAPLREWKQAVARRGAAAEVERVLLIQSALARMPHIAGLPVSDEVKRLTCEEFCFFASANAMAQVDASVSRFVGMCKTASLRRFRAGLFDWEVSGVSRSDVAAVSVRQLPRTLAFVCRRMRGLGPIFFSHLNARRATRSLSEDTANRSYYQMAKSMELQPAIKGFAACSWFRSPGTHRVSPHLGWLSDVFREHGGLVVESGPADPDCGVFSRSQTRKRLYEAGTFTPTRGLVLWPRDTMIAWAASHPEWAAPVRATAAHSTD